VFKIEGRGPQSNLIVTPGSDRRFFNDYECIASNRWGMAARWVKLREAHVPDLVQQVTRADLTATTVKFNIVGPVSFEGLPLRTFVVQYMLRDTLNWDRAWNKTWSVDAPYIVEGLIPQHTYLFRFAATNDVGIGNWGDQQDITMPRRSVPAEPRILVAHLNENRTRDFVDSSPYADHYELRWTVPSDNGDPIDNYQIRYCVSQRVNGEWRDSTSECSTNITTGYEYTSYQLEGLHPDTTYKIEVRAHNAIGYSLPGEIRVKTARGFDTSTYTHEGTAMSSGMIIGIAVGGVLILLIIVDVMCFCINRAGILALLCSRSKGIDEEDPKLSRDEKEPLNGELKNTTVEYDGRQIQTQMQKPLSELGRQTNV